MQDQHMHSVCTVKERKDIYSNFFFFLISLELKDFFLFFILKIKESLFKEIQKNISLIIIIKKKMN